MKRTSKVAHAVFSVLMGLTLIVSAVQPMKVFAATQIEQSPAIAPVDTVALKVKELIARDESAPVNVPVAVVADKPADDSQQSGTWPVYFEVVLDEARGWIYGSDSEGAKIDVIRISDLQLVKSISLPGTAPKGIALSPDGSELAIANYGIGDYPVYGNILFINPDTGNTNATVAFLLNEAWSNRPWELLYGKAGRLYSVGNSDSYGLDFVHVIDTATHTEVGHSGYPNTVHMCPSIAISSDKNNLYVYQSCQGPIDLTKYDITTDVPTPVVSAPFGSAVTGTNVVLSADGNKIFTNSGQVWSSGLQGQIGSTEQAGNIALLPTRNAIAVTVDNDSGNDAVSFYSVDNYYGITTYSLPTQGTLGPIVALSDGSKLFVDSSNGFFAVNLSSGLPGTPIPLPNGSLPYYDLVADNARGVLYGSDSTGHKIDLISMTTLQVVKRYRLVNGATPKGIALSPDGSELAVAEYGASSIVFLNPQTGQTVASLMPSNDTLYPPFNNHLILPWDLVYGRAGRLYSVGNPESSGSEYVHIIDTITHSELSRPPYDLGGRISLQISADKKTLYYLDSNSTTPGINGIDVTSDSLPLPMISYAGDSMGTVNFILSENGDKLITDSGHIFSTDLRGPIGSTGQVGNLALLPTRNAIAVAVDNSGNDAVSFYSTNDYYGITTFFLPALGTMGPMVARSNGSKLFVSSSSGITAIDLSSGIPGVPIPPPNGSLPYYDLVADDARSVLYGSDSNGHKIDVISMATLQVVNQYRLVNGATPKAIALSPDGNELAVAEYGASSIVFLNPQTGQTIASLIPDAGTNFPWDLVYGRAGRLYSVGNPSSFGMDNIHVIATTTHTEVGISVYPDTPRMCPALAISSDNNSLYVYESCQSPAKINKFDLTTDTPTSIASSPHADWLSGTNIVLSADDSKIFTDSGQVWNSNLIGQIGSTGQSGNIILLPTHNAIAVTVDNSGNDAISFYSTEDYYGIKTYTLPALGTLGPIAVKPDGSKLFVSSSSGITAVVLPSGLPGTAIPLPTGTQPYFDLVIDEARGVLYGSDPYGQKIDVISMVSLKVVKQYRLVNGALPVGMDLSPDGGELAVAEYGASSIVFLNPDTGQVIASLFPQAYILTLPWDVIYGRSGRLYSTGAPTSYGLDYVHAIDTVTHTEVGHSDFDYFVRDHPSLAISADYNTLYVDESYPSSHRIHKYDVSTDLPSKSASITIGLTFEPATILLLSDETKILTSDGEVVDNNLENLLGTFSPAGKLAEIPSHNAFLSAAGTQITYFSSTSYSLLGASLLSGVTNSGPVVVKSDDSALFVSTDIGIKTVDLTTAPLYALYLALVIK